MTGALEASDLVVWIVSFQVALLGLTGSFHLGRPEHMRSSARQHVATGAISRSRARFESPVLVGTLEILGALLASAALLSGSPRFVVASQVLLVLLALGFLAFLARLRRVAPEAPCGCQPLSSTVTNATLLPAATLLFGAVAVAVMSLAARSSVSIGSDVPRIALTVALGAGAAGTVLVRAAASSGRVLTTRKVI